MKKLLVAALFLAAVVNSISAFAQSQEPVLTCELLASENQGQSPQPLNPRRVKSRPVNGNVVLPEIYFENVAVTLKGKQRLVSSQAQGRYIDLNVFDVVQPTANNGFKDETPKAFAKIGELSVPALSALGPNGITLSTFVVDNPSDDAAVVAVNCKIN
jgi:hypothetical protein